MSGRFACSSAFAMPQRRQAASVRHGPQGRAIAAGRMSVRLADYQAHPIQPQLRRLAILCTHARFALVYEVDADAIHGSASATGGAGTAIFLLMPKAEARAWNA